MTIMQANEFSEGSIRNPFRRETVKSQGNMGVINVRNGFAHGDYGSASNVETAPDAKSYDLNNIDIIGSSQHDMKNNATEVHHAYGKKFKFPLDNKDIKSELKP